MNIICHVCIAMISQYLNQMVNISQISIHSHHIKNNDDILVWCKVKTTFTPSVFEDKGKVANTPLWYDVSLPRYNLYQEHKREITHM